MLVKKFIQFVNEISGTEMVGPVGPGYGETRTQNKTITSFDTNVIYSDIGDEKLYTIDMYNQVYPKYLALGGEPLDGFSKKNIDALLFFLKLQEE